MSVLTARKLSVTMPEYERTMRTYTSQTSALSSPAARMTVRFD